MLHAAIDATALLDTDGPSDRPRHIALTFVGQTTTMAACAMSLPAVPGLLAAESCREFWTPAPTPRSGFWCVRESLTRFERLATEGDHPWGDRAKPLVGDLTADRARAVRRHHRRARLRRPCRALRRHLRHHRRRGRAARRQRRGHPGGDRAGPSPRRDAAPRVVDRGGRHLSRRIHRRRFRRRAGPADALSPDQVRGRAAGALGATACATGSTGPRWSSATHAPARWTRSTARTTSSASWRSWQAAVVHPGPAARHRTHQHRAGRLRRRCARPN